MQRIALGVEYDGRNYVGWQVQKNGRSVQACLEAALSRIADHPVRVTAAGRTDSGVHAVGQVVHFDTHAERTPRSWVLGVNSELDSDANVRWAQPVAAGFHARYSALARRYRYTIFNHAIRSAQHHPWTYWVRRPLDPGAMTAACSYLLGEHDFSSFRAAACQAKTPVRRVQRIAFERSRELITVDIRANAFLQNMVRIIVGVLIKVGTGEARPEWTRTVLENCSRIHTGATVPPCGLSLVEVRYPKEFAISGSTSESQWD